MGRFVVKKTAEMLVTLLLIIVIIFAIFEFVPGNPARIMLGMNASNAQVEALEKELGLDDPLPIKIKNYIANLLSGNLGQSIRFDEPVVSLLIKALPYTLFLALYAFLLILILSIPLALLAAGKPGSILDSVIKFSTEITLSIPPFFMAILLMLIFKTTQLSLNGAQAGFDFGSAWKRYLMPAIAIALSRIAMAMEFLRDSIVEQKQMIYVKTAIGKGASPKRVMFVHVLRNSLVPFVTVLGLILAEVFSGSIIIEQIFLIPGLGRLLVTAVETRDFPLTQGIILLIALVVVIVNFLVDFINQFIDPRIQTEQRDFLKPSLITRFYHRLQIYLGADNES